MAGRDVGSVPLSGGSVRQRHLHLQLSVSTLGWAPGHRRWSVDSQLPPIHRRRVRCRPEHPLPPSGERSFMVLSHQPVDGRGHAGEGRGRSATPPASSFSAPATTATSRATCRAFPASTPSRARWSTLNTGRKGFRCQDRRVVVIGSGATAVTLAPGPGAGGGPRDAAPALAFVRRQPAECRPSGVEGAPGLPAARRPPDVALEERAARNGVLPVVPAPARDRDPAAARRDRPTIAEQHTSTRISARGTAPGISVSASPPTATCSGPSGRAG